MVFVGYYSPWRANLLFVSAVVLAVISAVALQADHHPTNQDPEKSVITQGESLAASQPRNTSFLGTSGSTCDEVWMSWPSTQLQAMAEGTYFVFNLFPSVGNLFLTLNKMLPVVRFLEMGIALDPRKGFPGFRQAFEPSTIMWEIDPIPLKKRALRIEQGGSIDGFHALTVMDGVVVLSDAQLEIMISILGISTSTLSELAFIASQPRPRPTLRVLFTKLHNVISRQEYPRPQPCTWNMFLRRSSLLLESLELHSPWVSENGGLVSHGRPAEYVGWHIRTPGGESNNSYQPAVHGSYVFEEGPDVVCPAFEAATRVPRLSCKEFATQDMAIYISSNSKSFARSCIEGLAEHKMQGGQVDLGLGPNDAHTEFSRNPYAAVNAFLDYVLLLDAAVIIRSGSSFSGTIVTIRGFMCQVTRVAELSNRQLYVCTPNDSSC